VIFNQDHVDEGFDVGLLSQEVGDLSDQQGSSGLAGWRILHLVNCIKWSKCQGGRSKKNIPTKDWAWPSLSAIVSNSAF